MALMFQSHGISEFGIAALLIMWSIFVIMFQPIVGHLGDKYPRKNILLVGQITKLACFAVFLTIPNFYGYLLGFALWGFQWAAEASVADAFLYDELRVLKAKEKYTAISGTSLAFYNVGMLVSTVGSLVAAYLGYAVVLYMTMACMIMSMICIASIKMQQPKSYGQKSKSSGWANLHKGFCAITSTKFILPMLFLYTFITCLSEQDDFIGLLGTEIGVSLEFVGLLFAISRMGEILGGATAKYFEKLLKGRRIYIFAALAGAVFAMSFFADFASIWLILFAGYFMYAIVRTLLMARIQKMLPSSRRATILALIDILAQLTMIVFYVLMSVGASLYGYRLGFLMLGGIIAVTGLYVMLFLKRLPAKVASDC
jgi:MFS family permease